MLNSINLTKNPQQEQQPCSMSCVPTCLAMAFGVGPQQVVDDMTQIGIHITTGLDRRQECFYLSRKGIGSQRFLNCDGIGLLQGHYLIEVPSLNRVRVVHCLYMHINDYGPTVFDPNKGRGVVAYDTSSVSALPIISVTKLDDFSDLLAVASTPPTEEIAEHVLLR